ncbi:MAG: PEP-CTERM sorting domain-containing protein [Planctomycetes bacterium]|nr:PEP-CTERM sorting domain-containing protein [Planctomycetota bacterium]
MRTVIGTVVVAALCLTGSMATAGRIVLAEDDWTLSDTGFNAPNDPGAFAANVAAWFTGGQAGSFLAYSNNFGLTGSLLGTAMETAGHTWTVSTAGPLDLARLTPYDGVFLSVAYTTGVDIAALQQYVDGGGAVYLYAGAGSVAMWNDFLLPYGLAYATGYNPLVGNRPIDSDHPLFAGVDSLYDYNGNDVYDLDPADPANEILVTSQGRGLYAVYDSSVPEPATAALLVIGAAVLARKRR